MSRERVPKSCLLCNAIFVPYRDRQFLCSRKCSEIWRGRIVSKRMRGKPNYRSVSRIPNCKIPSEKWKLGYLAGLIDGEGHLALHREASSYMELRPVLEITNTDPRMILWISEEFGLKMHRKKPRKATYKVPYNVRIHQLATVQTILEAVLPYLINKREAAEAVLLHIKQYFEHYDKVVAYAKQKHEAWLGKKSLNEIREEVLAEEMQTE